MGLLMGKQVQSHQLVPGYTELKLLGKMNKGTRLLVTESRDANRKTLSPDVSLCQLPGVIAMCCMIPEMLTSTDLPPDAGLGVAHQSCAGSK